MKTIAKFFAILLIVFSLQGCVSDTVRNAIDTADEHIRLKWSEEWKPALMTEISSATDEAKDTALREAIEKIESYEKLNDEKLKQINVNIKDFDDNKDGRITGQESIALLQEIKKKNDENGNPLSWWEIMLLMAGSYLPMTGGKEFLRAKMTKKGTGDGSQPAV